MPTTFLKVAAGVALGAWAFLSIGCSPTLATIGLEAAADSILLGQSTLANMAAAGQGTQAEISSASIQLSAASKKLWAASNQIKGGVDPLTLAQIIDELSSAAALLVPAPWGPLVKPIISAVYSAIELIIHHMRGPGGLAPRLAGSVGSNARPIKLTMGDRQVIDRVVGKLEQADAISARIPGR